VHVWSKSNRPQSICAKLWGCSLIVIILCIFVLYTMFN
jgi:hypothetical protein